MAMTDDEEEFNKKMATQDAELEKLKKEFEQCKANLERMALTPYAFNRLDILLSFDSWQWSDGLLLLVGGDPKGADIDWDGYENYCGVYIDSPKVSNIEFLDCRLPRYDVPYDYSYGDDKNYFRGDKTIEQKIREINILNCRLGELYAHWKNALEPHKERNSPSYYIDWAISKSFKIDWLDWAIENKLYIPSEPTIEVIPQPLIPDTQVNNDDSNGDDTEPTRHNRLYGEIAEITNYKTIGKSAIRKILATYIEKTGSCIKSLNTTSISWVDWQGDNQVTTNDSLGKWLTRQK